MENDIDMFYKSIKDAPVEYISELLKNIYQLGQCDAMDEQDRSDVIGMLPIIDTCVAEDYINILLDDYEDMGFFEED